MGFILVYRNWGRVLEVPDGSTRVSSLCENKGWWLHAATYLHMENTTI
jgi:hypothetical protein